MSFRGAIVTGSRYGVHEYEKEGEEGELGERRERQGGKRGKDSKR